MIIVFFVWLCFSGPNDAVIGCDWRRLAMGADAFIAESFSLPPSFLVL